jgi:hypothetical protein
LTIRPETGYAETYQKRGFSVYLPKHITDEKALEPRVTLELADVIGQVELIDHSVFLNPHVEYERLLMGYFRIVGSENGSSSYIIAKVGELKDVAEFHVKQPGKRPKQRRLQKRIGGLFENIDFDEKTPEPIQRVLFKEGVITVFLNFSPIRNYLGPGGEGMATYQGSLMLAELVSEAFCTELARRRIDTGVIPLMQGGEIDGYRSEVNKLMRKYLRFIHKILIERET